MWSTIRIAAARQLRVGGAPSASRAVRLTSRVATRQSSPIIPSSYRFQLLTRRGFAEARGRSPTKKKTKTTAAKRGSKTAPKEAAPKKRVRKAPSPEAKRKADIRQLRQQALLSEPKTLPSQPWLLFVTRHSKELSESAVRGEALGSHTKQLAESFRALSSSEQASLRATVEQNKLANAAAYRSWVESHTPAEIAQANKARRRLKSVFKVNSRGPIRDDRQPKRPANGFFLYVKSRWQSGDFSGHKLADATKAMVQEWKAMSYAEREPFNISSKADKQRYAKEAESVFNQKV